MKGLQLVAVGLITATTLVVFDEPVRAQSTSEAVARRLSELMAERKLDSVAAREEESGDRFVAALYFPGQLLVVSARYAAPAVLRERLLSHDYRDVYLQLQGAGDPTDKFFVQDLGADGIHAAPTTSTIDIVYESVDNRTVFDGDWRKQKLTEQAYHDRVMAVDRRYASLLAALMAEIAGTTKR